MKKVLGCIRKCDDRFGLIAEDDSICVGLSGGKDSLALVKALGLYRLFSKKSFSLHAVTVDLGFGSDFSALARFCESCGVPFTTVPTQIGPLVFETRQEKNPCALCANMRRGALNTAAVKLGCNKVALGHNREDALETLLLSWIYESRLHVFQPKTYLSRQNITVIRPLTLCPEKELVHLARKENFPVMPPCCPAAGATKREDMRQLLRQLEKNAPGAVDRMTGALLNPERTRLWD
ncbi:MAG: tRNA 2-thiocytidine biosynthesis TtcA family protein [Clostridia bacterium]|nr:tRNA 2-thiocytidine biosynthesis TtcA family protein [Clostridia bacterium]